MPGRLRRARALTRTHRDKRTAYNGGLWKLGILNSEVRCAGGMGSGGVRVPLAADCFLVVFDSVSPRVCLCVCVCLWIRGTDCEVGHQLGTTF